ncbi:MAG: hypothetical protein Gaeavirus5_6 [Gaeavirus sp.]|uniref:Uncharacterized protein n=1 Tax=Gaeavirus sp. TaxID=2487767 RepID=A0A3G5A3H0_9VIRU|nr:MAG: hypothetical protein Gaeavirus5_6 [Gaeavirus sp.]
MAHHELNRNPSNSNIFLLTDNKHRIKYITTY